MGASVGFLKVVVNILYICLGPWCLMRLNQPLLCKGDAKKVNPKSASTIKSRQTLVYFRLAQHPQRVAHVFDATGQ